MSIETLLISVFTVIASVGSSAGFWAYFQTRSNKKSATTQLLRGLAHQKIISLGTKYIDQGYITLDEYDDFVHYIYKPYEAVGGNGLAERIFNAVHALPVRKTHPDINEIQVAGDDII